MRLTTFLRREPLLLAALAMLCCGDMINLGEFSISALALIAGGVVTAVLALRAPDGDAPAVMWVAGVAACAIMVPVLSARLGTRAETIVGCVLLAAAAAAVAVTRRRVGVLCGIVAVAAVVATTVLPWRFGHADIDVFTSVQQAASAILHGQNPYSTTFLTPDEVAPQVFVLQRVHFQYLPGVALLAAPARVLGDVRLMAVVASVALIAAVTWLAWQAPDRRTRTLRVAIVCIALPVSAVVLVNAWVDVYAVAGMAAWLALRRSHPRLALVPLLIALTIKPTILIALLPLLAWSQTMRREAVIAAAGAAAVTAPFIVATGVAPFLHDVAGVQASLGFRYDGLTLNALTFAFLHTVPPVWLTLAVGATAAVTLLLRRPRDLSDALIVGAVLSTVAFLLAKWAFLNYYYIPVWLLAIALAARGVPLDEPDRVALPLVPWLRERWRGLPVGLRRPVTQLR